MSGMDEINDLQFVACDAMVGVPRQPLASGDSSVADLEQEMARLNLRAAVVRHRFCQECAPYLGNQILMDEIRGHANLLPAWVLTPDGDEPDFDIAATVQRMLKAGVKLAWISPKRHSFSVERWCSGDLYAALAEARVPLLLDWDLQTPNELNHMCAEFPGLRVVILNPSRDGRDRLLFPLLKQHQNLHLCFSPVYGVHEGFRHLVKQFGASRWVFGTGYPEAEVRGEWADVCRTARRCGACRGARKH